MDSGAVLINFLLITFDSIRVRRDGQFGGVSLSCLRYCDMDAVCVARRGRSFATVQLTHCLLNAMVSTSRLREA